MVFSGGIRDPHEWLHEQEQRTSALLAKARDAQASLAENSVTLASPDQVVTITVNPGGGMTGLTLSPDADRMGHRQLAGLVMATYNQAARQAATRTMEIMSELVGGDSEALDLVRQAMPAPPEDEDPRRSGTNIDDDGGFQGFRGDRG